MSRSHHTHKTTLEVLLKMEKITTSGIFLVCMAILKSITKGRLGIFYKISSAAEERKLFVLEISTILYMIMRRLVEIIVRPNNYRGGGKRWRFVAYLTW